MIRPRVQIADDHLMFADPAGRYLATHYEVMPPITDLDAIPAALRLHQVRVLLLDISFGTRSALTILPRLVREFPDTLIVMVTGHAVPDMVQRALTSGARGYVLKDGGPAELVHAVETVLRGQIYLSEEVRQLATPTRLVLKRPLSERQQAVLKLLRKGHTGPRIAEEMEISLSTVEKHVRAIKERLGILSEKRGVQWKALKIDGPP
jgi:two-component system nitrate/nitrite response regulator NarL